jgi:hypothetical protein
VTASVFADIKDQSFPYRYHGTIEVDTLIGGIPSDPNVARGWIESKAGITSEEQINRMVAETMVDRKVGADEALDIVNKLKNLNGFLKTPDGQFVYPGRCLKAAMKEAVSVAVSSGKIEQRGWGNTKKWIGGFFPEHVFVEEVNLPLFTWDNGVLVPVEKESEVKQQFVHTRFGSSIQYQEAVYGAVFDFTVVSDFNFTDDFWQMLWTTGEMNGLGASRSQGYGTYRVTQWDKEIVGNVKAATVQNPDELPSVRTRRSKAA